MARALDWPLPLSVWPPDNVGLKACVRHATCAGVPTGGAKALWPPSLAVNDAFRTYRRERAIRPGRLYGLVIEHIVACIRLQGIFPK